MKISDEIKEELRQLYNAAKKLTITGHGNGWVDLAAFGWAVNKAHIDYKGSDGKGKLTHFLLTTDMFDIISPNNKFIRIKDISNSSTTSDDDSLPFADVPEAAEQQETEAPPVVQPTIFEEETPESATKVLIMDSHDVSTSHSQIDDKIHQ